jgi:hypothetical protein
MAPKIKKGDQNVLDRAALHNQIGEKTIQILSIPRQRDTSHIVSEYLKVRTLSGEQLGVKAAGNEAVRDDLLSYVPFRESLDNEFKILKNERVITGSPGKWSINSKKTQAQSHWAHVAVQYANAKAQAAKKPVKK